MVKKQAELEVRQGRAEKRKKLEELRGAVDLYDVTFGGATLRSVARASHGPSHEAQDDHRGHYQRSVARLEYPAAAGRTRRHRRGLRPAESHPHLRGDLEADRTAAAAAYLDVRAVARPPAGRAREGRRAAARARAAAAAGAGAGACGGAAPAPPPAPAAPPPLPPAPPPPPPPPPPTTTPKMPPKRASFGDIGDTSTSNDEDVPVVDTPRTAERKGLIGSAMNLIGRMRSPSRDEAPAAPPPPPPPPPPAPVGTPARRVAGAFRGRLGDGRHDDGVGRVLGRRSPRRMKRGRARSRCRPTPWRRPASVLHHYRRRS